MESFTSTLLPLRFVASLDFREPALASEGDTFRKTLKELPDWAPPQAQGPLDRFSAFEDCDNHYESWQGISW